jgi:hypothetical protein
MPSPKRSLLACAALVCSPVPAAAQEAAPTTGAPRVSIGIESATLADVGPWGAAVTLAGAEPLPSDLWRGADAATLAALLERIGHDHRFPIMADLARRTIFSGGAAPNADPALARARFSAAARLGPPDAAAQLTARIPQLASDPDLAAIAVDAALRAGEIEEGCTLVQAVEAPASGTFWLEARATCFALQDEFAAADLSLDLAKARGLADPWLGRAIAATAGASTNPPPFRAGSGVTLALSLKAGLKPPRALLDGPDVASLPRLALAATLSPAERAEYARAAAIRGTGTIAAWRVAVDSASPPAPPVDPASVTPQMRADAARQTAERLGAASTPSARSATARLLHEALREAALLLAPAPSPLPAPAVATTGPVDDAAAIAPTPAPTPAPALEPAILARLAEGALWVGDAGLARQFLDAMSAPPASLSLALALADAGAPPRAVERRLDAATDEADRRVALREAVLGWSAGLAMTGGQAELVRNALPADGAALPPGMRTALDFAVRRGGKAEVALVSALALEGIEPAALGPEALGEVIRALRDVGLNDVARRLALEGVLALRMAPPARGRAAPPAGSRPAARPTPASATPPVRAPAPAPTTRAPGPRAAADAPARLASPPPPPPPPPPPRAKPSWGAPAANPPAPGGNRPAQRPSR